MSSSMLGFRRRWWTIKFRATDVDELHQEKTCTFARNDETARTRGHGQVTATPGTR